MICYLLFNIISTIFVYIIWKKESRTQKRELWFSRSFSCSWILEGCCRGT